MFQEYSSLPSATRRGTVVPTASLRKTGEKLWRGFASNRAIPGRRVSVITSLFKKAVLRQHENLIGRNLRRCFTATGSKARDTTWLDSLPYPMLATQDHADESTVLLSGYHRERIERPGSGLGPCVHSITHLFGAGLEVAVRPHTGEPRPVAARPERWLRTSRRWVTVFPAVHERRGPLDVAGGCAVVQTRRIARARCLSVNAPTAGIGWR